MKIQYQATVQCEACGVIGHVGRYTPGPGRWETPLPPGWGLSGGLRLVDASGMPHQEFCDACMRLPLGELVAKMIEWSVQGV